MSNINNIIRPDLLDFSAYRATANREQLGEIWLNANELPFNTHTSLNNVLMNRYPHRRPQDLLELLAKHYNVTTQQLLLSRGADEAIDLLIRLCCRAGKDNIMICPPTFNMFETYAKLQSAGVIKVPLDASQGFKLPLQSIINNCDDTVKLIFLCSPNNPTGNTIATDDIIQLCQTVKLNSLVVVDEAYIEFSQTPSMIQYLDQLENLVVIRTLSKAFGLAGARCGATMAHPSIIEWLIKISAPYPLPTPSIEIIKQALTAEQLKENHEFTLEIINARNKLEKILALSPYIEYVWPSEGNFLLLKTTDAKQFIQLCLEHSIIIRDLSTTPGLENCVRIAIGTPNENQKLVNAIAGAHELQVDTL